MKAAIAIGFAWMLTCFSCQLCAQQTGGQHPNIILFLVDDMGWQDCSVPFWNQITPLNKKYHTPSMERLAARGMKFTSAYANPVCTPTRVSLMTGMNEARHNVTNWTDVIKDSPTDSPDSILKPANWNYNGLSPVLGINRTVYATPLPQLLKDAGYFTIHCGKAHFASYGTPASNPLAIGFEKNIGGSSAGHPGSYLGSKNYRSNPADTLRAVRGLEKYASKNIYLTEALTEEVIATLNEKKDNRPFFLYMAQYAVHLPFEKDERFYQKYIDRGLTDTEAKYAALIEGMDKSLGDIMDYLTAGNLDKNTYIIFMSDNGGLSLTPQRSGEIHTQNLPLKQGKGSLYEGGIREPMIVAGPRIEQRAASSQNVSIDDFFPTILDIAGIKKYKTVQTLDGKSLLPFFLDKNKRDADKILLWHYPNNWTNKNFHGTSWVSAVRKGAWKLIFFHKTGELELYNTDDDIGEDDNLSAKFPERRKEMAALLTKELKKRNAQMPSFKASGKQIPWPDEIKQ